MEFFRLNSSSAIPKANLTNQDSMIFADLGLQVNSQHDNRFSWNFANTIFQKEFHQPWNFKKIHKIIVWLNFLSIFQKLDHLTFRP